MFLIGGFIFTYEAVPDYRAAAAGPSGSHGVVQVVPGDGTWLLSRDRRRSRHSCINRTRRDGG